MKVYVVTNKDYDLNVTAVFIDKQSAVTYCAMSGNSFKEYDTEDYAIEKGKIVWCAEFRENGEMYSLGMDRCTFRDYNKVFEGEGVMDEIYFTTGADIDREQAQQIAYEKYAQYKAEKDKVKISTLADSVEHDTGIRIADDGEIWNVRK